jgi:type VI secretion system VasD/TssJ family lipoprotein
LKHSYNVLFVLVIVLSVCACSRPIPPPAPPKWEYGEDAIKLQIKADPYLNWHGGTSHTLHLCVYQLKDRNVFANLAGYEKGLRTLLHYRCELFDQTVVTSKSLFIHPGEYLSLTRARAKDAQYVAIAAEYEEFSKNRAIRDIKIPVIVEKKGFFGEERFANLVT